MRRESETPKVSRILRMADVRERTGLSRGGVYLRIKRCEFPDSIPLGGRAVGWLESEIDTWIDNRIRASKEALYGEN